MDSVWMVYEESMRHVWIELVKRLLKIHINLDDFITERAVNL